MNEDLVGKVLLNEKKESYIVLSMLSYKSIPCVLAQEMNDDGSEGEKKFFQLSTGDETSLVGIKSKKILNALTEYMESKRTDIPRKIKENESIPDYLAYLDDFYKTKVIASK